jgi:hypothetical protein
LMDQNFEIRCFFLMDKFGVGWGTEKTQYICLSWNFTPVWVFFPALPGVRLFNK